MLADAQTALIKAGCRVGLATVVIVGLELGDNAVQSMQCMRASGMRASGMVQRPDFGEKVVTSKIDSD